MINIEALSPYIRHAASSHLLPNKKIRSRTLFDYCLIYVEEGEMNIRMGNKNYVCGANDVVLLRPNIEHEEQCCTNQMVSQPHIHFDMQYDENSTNIRVSFKSIKEFTEEEKRLIRPDVFSGLDMPSPIIKVKDKKLFRDLLYEIIFLYKNKPKLYQIIAKEKMLHLLYMIFSEYEAFSFSSEMREDILVLQIKDYIDNNVNEVITLDMLSLQFHYNKYYLEKIFKNKVGVSIIKYYNNARIRQAKLLLLSSASVSKVSEKMNFGSAALFSRFFKMRLGISPREYIQKNK